MGALITHVSVHSRTREQKCIWNHYGGEGTGKAEGVGLPWWGYVREFHERCSKRGRFTDVGCVKEAMKAAGVDFSRIQQCMDDAGGVDQDRENTILQNELVEKQKKSIVIVPSVYVNNVRGEEERLPCLSSSLPLALWPSLWLSFTCDSSPPKNETNQLQLVVIIFAIRWCNGAGCRR